MKNTSNLSLTALTNVAKHIIYDPQRFKILLKMLGSQQGAIMAVHSVIAAMQKQFQINPQMLPQLGVNIYLLMVDVAQEVTKHKADPSILHAVIQQIMQSAPSLAQGAQPAGQPPQQGIIGSQMGAQQ